MRKSKLLNFGEGGMPLESQNPPEFKFLANDGSSSQGVFTYAFQSNIEQELYFTVKIPFSYNEGTDIFPYVHYCPLDNGSGNITWGLEYTWTNPTNTVGPTTIILTSGLSITSNTQNQHYVNDINPGVGIIGTTKTRLSVLMCRIFRQAAGSDPNAYFGDLGLMEIEFRYQQNGDGSTTKTSK